jgi:hypothetical protein
MQQQHCAAVLAALFCSSALPAFADSSFNPDISLVLQGLYKRADERSGEGLTGFWPATHAHETETEAPRTRGFLLGESELVMSANVDQHFKGLANLAFSDEHGAEVEEAYLQTLALGNGLTVKGGRFLSGIGYSNEQHPHVWDFADATLMQTALFGEHGYAQDGVQARWLAPTETFLEFGLEAGRGDNFPGTERNESGSGSVAVFAHVGGDIGEAHSWRAGVSWLETRATERDRDALDVNDVDVETPFTGKSRTALVDFVWKWAIAPGRSFKLQAEAFRRKESGDVTCVDAGTTPSACASAPTDSYESTQRGGYVQGVYQFAREWRAGVRYDRLETDEVSFGSTLAAALPASPDYAPRRVSVMTDWSPSEFSRLRLQLARDKSQQGLTDDQLTLQYIVSLGAHSAHRY